MLILGSRLNNIPIMGLQTGTRLATVGKPVINPGNLKIIAYEATGALLSEYPSFIRIADVRELSDIGIIIDSNDEFVGLNDVIKIKENYELNFDLIGLNVIDEAKHKLGKVYNYSLDTDSFIIQQLNVKQSIFKSLSDSELLIHRSQIIEINDNEVIVKATLKKLDPVTKTEKISYMNPFRSQSPQTKNSKTT